LSQFGVRLMLQALNLLKQELGSGNCKMAFALFLRFCFYVFLPAARPMAMPCRSWALMLSRHLHLDCLLGPTWPVSFRSLTQVK
jgi:hypothetical protein